MAENNKNDGRIGEIVNGFYRARATFNGFYKTYQEGGSVGARDFMNLTTEHMVPLKELADDFLRPTGDRKADLETNLFDMVLGELVHEVNDLSSAIHQVSKYKPQIDEYVREDGLSEAETELVDELRKILDDAQERIPRKYDEVKGLFDRTTDVLEQNILPMYKDNATLLQSMLINESVFEDEEGNRFPIIFGHMFEDGMFEAYAIVSSRLLEHYHVESAIKYLNVVCEQYDQMNGDEGFVDRNRGRVEGLLGGVKGALGMLPALKEHGEIRGDLKQIKSQVESLSHKLEGYLA